LHHNLILQSEVFLALTNFGTFIAIIHYKHINLIHMKVSRLFDYIVKQFDDGILNNCVGKLGQNGWEFYSTGEVLELSREMASGLLEKGIGKGDKVGIVVYKNRPEWAIVDLAIQYIGAISVPMYATINAKEYQYIMNEAEVKLCFVGKDDLYDKVTAAQSGVASLKDVVCFDHQPNRPYWRDLMTTTKLEDVERLSQTVQTNDLVTIIYTSGTTGNPKGVMLTHSNIISVVEECITILPVTRGMRVLSFLPICHIFERAVLYVYQSIGVEIYFTGTDNLGGETGDLMNVKPHFFTTVPRLLEKVYEKIYNKGLMLTGIKKKLFFWALGLTDSFEHDKKYSGLEAIKMKIADKLIFSKWRAALGGEVKSIATGAAACPAKIARIFSAAGIIITEGYGLTETSPVLTLNACDGPNKIGSVGVVLDIVDLRIDNSEGTYGNDEGEIIASGPNIMLGYYKKPKETEEVFKMIDGKPFFKTGDIGKFVYDTKGNKFLQITDRKKELLKTSGGKYVAPAPIENKLKEEFLIEQAMVVGDNLKFVSAIIVPAAEALIMWSTEHGIQDKNIDNLIKNPKVIAKYDELVNIVNQDLGHVEQIKKFTLISGTWEPIRADGTESELTPTMKLKRRVILEKYQKVIASLYA